MRRVEKEVRKPIVHRVLDQSQSNPDEYSLMQMLLITRDNEERTFLWMLVKYQLVALDTRDQENGTTIIGIIMRQKRGIPVVVGSPGHQRAMRAVDYTNRPGKLKTAGDHREQDRLKYSNLRDPETIANSTGTC